VAGHPPSWRFDITIEADLIEELARSAGLRIRLPRPPPAGQRMITASSEAKIGSAPCCNASQRVAIARRDLWFHRPACRRSCAAPSIRSAAQTAHPSRWRCRLPAANSRPGHSGARMTDRLAASVAQADRSMAPQQLRLQRRVGETKGHRLAIATRCEACSTARSPIFASLLPLIIRWPRVRLGNRIQSGRARQSSIRSPRW